MSQRWEPKEHGAERTAQYSPSQEASPEDYAKVYVYGSHLEPGLERRPDYLTPREKEAADKSTMEARKQEAREEMSGILARAEQRSIQAQQAEQVYKGILSKSKLPELRQTFFETAQKLQGISESLSQQEASLQEQKLIQEQRSLGYVLSGKVETPEGVEYLFVPSEQKGLAESLLGLKLPTLGLREKLAPKTPLEKTVTPTKHPLAMPAGAIASGESFVYGLARLAGFKTPRIPPTIISGLIGTPFGSKELEETMGYGPEYAAGTIVGDVLISMAMGKAIGKAYEKTLKPKVQSWLTQQYLEKGPLEWKGFTEKAVMRLTGTKPYLATEIVSVPSMETVGMEGLQSQFMAWELAETPKASAFIVSKMPSEKLAKAWAMEHLVKSVSGGLSYALVREQLTRMEEPKLPYVPKGEVAKPSMFLPKLASVGITLGLKMVPKRKVTREPYELQKLRTTPPQIITPKKKEHVIPIVTPKIATAPFTEVAPKQVPKLISRTKLSQTQTQRQIQKQAQQQLQRFEPQLQKQKTTRLPKEYQLPKISKAKRKQLESLFGRQRRIYPVATPEQVLKEISP
jgi:hypothetical protein